MSQQVLDEVTLDNTGDGGSFNETYDSIVLSAPDVPDNEENVDVAKGISIRRGYRKEVSFMVLDPDTFAGTGANDSLIDDAMETRLDTEVTFSWQGTSSDTVLSGCKLLAQPVMDEVPDNVSVWYDTDTSATDNPGNEASNTADSSWTELAEVLGETSHESENITTPNGRTQPYWVRSMFAHPIPMFYDATAYSTIKTVEDNLTQVRVAIENQAGNYRVYGGNGTGVYVRIHEQPNPGPDDLATMVMDVFQSASFTDIITFPNGAENYFYGTEVTLETWGHDEADVLTENRTF